MRTRSRSTATIRWPGGRSGPGSRSSTCAWPRPRNCSSGSAEARPARHAGPVEWPHACNLHIAGQPAAGRAALARGPQLRALGGADLPVRRGRRDGRGGEPAVEIGRASCRERVCKYVEIWVVAGSFKKKKKKNKYKKE